MRSFAIVFRREFVERRNVVFTAAAASLIPILMPLLPSVPITSRGELRVVLAFALAATFAASVALASGVSLFSRDLADGRAGFLFSRPLGEAAIWGGKILAGVALVFATIAIIAAPSMAIERSLPRGWMIDEPWQGAAFSIAAVLLLLLLGNTLGVMVRSRRLFVVADFVLAVLAGAIGWVTMMRFAWLTLSSGQNVVLVLSLVFASVVFFALLAGSYAQNAVGRSDIARAHRALSLTIWPVLFTFLVLFALVVIWMPRVGPADLDRVVEVRSGPESWIAVTATAKARPDAYATTMIVDAAKPARFLQLDTPLWPGSIAFSRDGRRAAWLATGFDTRWLHGTAARHVAIANLEGRPRTQHTDVRLSSRGAVALSDGGNRLAVWDLDQATVYDTATMKSLGSVQAAGDYVRMYFMPSGELRIMANRSASAEVAILTWQPNDRRITTTGSFGDAQRVVVDASGSRALAQYGRSLTLCDAATGVATARLLDWPDTPAARASATFLSDNRIVVSQASAGRNTLHVFDAAGTKIRTVALPPSDWLAVNEEVAPDVLLIRAGSGRGEGRGFRTLAIDLSTGRVRGVVNDAIPASTWSSYGTDPRVGPQARTVALLNARTESLERLDPASWKTVSLFSTE